MRLYIVNLILVMIFCIFPSAINADSLINVSTKTELYTFSNDIYDFIARIVIKGYVDDFPKNIYPYSRGDIAKILFNLSLKVNKGKAKLSEIDKKELERMYFLFSGALENKATAESIKPKKHILDIIGDEYNFYFGGGISQKIVYRDGDGFPKNGIVNITSLRPSLSGQIKDSFAFTGDVKWDYDYGDIFDDLIVDEAKISYDKYNTVNVVSTQSYSVFKLPWFKLLYGKDNVRWGPGYHGQLMVSSNPQPMDMLRLDGSYGKNIKFQSLTAKLLNKSGSKYMSAHRLDVLLWKKLEVGLSESIIYGEKFDTSYLSPIQLYAVSMDIEEPNTTNTHNLLESVDFSCTDN